VGERECPNKDRVFVLGEKHGPAQPEHTCPFQTEINDDEDFLCECCEACERECSDDI
jgi:hypothetical protein